MVPALHYKQKEKATNLRQKYFYYYDIYTLVIFNQNQKGTSNKFALEIFSSSWYLYFGYISSKAKRNKQEICPRNIFITMIPILYLYFIKAKKEQAINLQKKYFHHFDTYTLLLFHRNQRGTRNKFAPEIFSSIWNLYFIINKKNKQ